MVRDVEDFGRLPCFVVFENIEVLLQKWIFSEDCVNGLELLMWMSSFLALLYSLMLNVGWNMFFLFAFGGFSGCCLHSHSFHALLEE